MCIYINVHYQWDPEKAKINVKKHGIEFADAVGVLEDPWALTTEDSEAESEPRFLTLGSDILGRILVVVYVLRGKEIRLVSARKATKKEREEYAKGIRF